MKNIIVGTAGHIDHGKTSLIKALTGYDADRLAEEKRRGITIELGFTHFDLPSGTRIGIIDVPGHEKFVGNMVTGVVGMDLVLILIAADEGIMPQTREHIAILEQLGVSNAILVLSKCDMVDQDWIDLIQEEIREELKTSLYANAPMVRVSSVTGMGIPELTEMIVRRRISGVLWKATNFHGTEKIFLALKQLAIPVVLLYCDAGDYRITGWAAAGLCWRRRTSA